VYRLLENTYNFLEQHHQHLLDYFYAFIEWLKPNEWEPGYFLCRKYAQELLKRTQPDIIVSVHPMINHFLKRAIDEIEFGKKPELIVVLTDPNDQFWSGWACRGANLTLVPNDLAKNKVVALGLDASKVRIVGMPVSSCFARPCKQSRADFLLNFNLQPDVLTICLCAGGAGAGKIEEIYNKLTEVKRKIQVIAICGRNVKLIETIRSLSWQAKLPTVVLARVDSMNELMNACDLLVTKPGGLTTFEAIARRLPIAFEMIGGVMPQERGTGSMLLSCGVSQAIRRAEDILPIINDLKAPGVRDKNPITSEHSLDKTDAANTIAKIIMTESIGDECLESVPGALNESFA
jgi:UDP-N-acetylglucosamine:LPS N-acetylglucosamine transferase